MSNRVLNAISNHRGKLGAAAGAATMYGASQIESPLLNQAGFNILARGQNLALGAADKIGYGKEQLQNLGMREIDPEAIEITNAIANIPGVSLKGPLSGVNTAEKITAMRKDFDNARDYAIGLKDQGVNYLKEINPFNESTNVVKIQIKDLLLEGYHPEAIVEAVHANHPRLNKRLLKDPTISYKDGKAIEIERKNLADDIRRPRQLRDEFRKKSVTDVKGTDVDKRERTQDANYWDNEARARSQTGGRSSGYAAEYENLNPSKRVSVLNSVPRVISSAKQ